jgi:hypothetical protein
VMHNVEGSDPASDCAHALICWRCSMSGGRRCDQTAIFLSRFRIRSGNSSRERARRCTRAVCSITRTRPGRPHSSPVRRGSTRRDRRAPLSRAQECNDRSDSKARPRSSGPPDCRAPPPHPDSGRRTVVGASAQAEHLQEFSNPSAGGDAQAARCRCLTKPS